MENDEGAALRLLRLLAEGAPASELSAADDPDGEARELALLVRAAFDSRRRREAELTALVDTARDLASLRDPSGVLDAIVRRARTLLGTDVAYLTLYDREAGDTFMRATDGSVSAEFQTVRLSLGDGLGGLVAKTHKPYWTADYFRRPPVPAHRSDRQRRRRRGPGLHLWHSPAGRGRVRRGAVRRQPLPAPVHCRPGRPARVAGRPGRRFPRPDPVRRRDGARPGAALLRPRAGPAPHRRHRARRSRARPLRRAGPRGRRRRRHHRCPRRPARRLGRAPRGLRRAPQHLWHHGRARRIRRRRAGQRGRVRGSPRDAPDGAPGTHRRHVGHRRQGRPVRPGCSRPRRGGRPRRRRPAHPGAGRGGDGPRAAVRAHRGRGGAAGPDGPRLGPHHRPG